MEVKKDGKDVKIPGWIIATGIVTIGGIVTEICKTITEKIRK